MSQLLQMWETYSYAVCTVF